MGRLQRSFSRLFLVALLGSLLVGTGASAAQHVFTDDFADGLVDPFLWTAAVGGSGPTVVENGGKLEVTIPAVSVADPVGTLMGAYTLNLQNVPLAGDFEAVVDYALVSWPAGSGVRVGFLGSKGGVERTGYSSWEYSGLGVPPEEYIVDFRATGDWVLQPQPALATADTSGRLRFTRVGNTLSGYYRQGGTWVLIGSFTGGTAAEPLLGPPGYLGIGAWSGPGPFFGYQDVKVTFSNFKLIVP
jgi:hypothetical protein